MWPDVPKAFEGSIHSMLQHANLLIFLQDKFDRPPGNQLPSEWHESHNSNDRYDTALDELPVARLFDDASRC